MITAARRAPFRPGRHCSSFLGKAVLSEGAAITSHHLHRDWNYDTVVGVIEALPANPGEVTLRDVSPDDWTTTPDGEAGIEAEIEVAPQRRLGARPMVIGFGSVQGRIRIG